MAFQDDKVIRDAQYRKGLSIAFFNATNAAIELTKPYKYTDEEAQKTAIVSIRDWLLEEHRTYYATTIAQIGSAYNTKNAIVKLKAAKTYGELGDAWRFLSEDERRDAEVVKVAKAMKLQLKGSKESAKPTKVTKQKHEKA